MPPNVVAGAMCFCSFGLTPSSLEVLPTSGVLVESMPAATIMDFAPEVNLITFGMCSSPSNPEVAAATAAALGVLTPMPCVPVPTAWKPGAGTTLVGGQPALTAGSTSQCAYGGVIEITYPGTKTTQSN